MPAALAAVFPRTTLQTCIVHLIRNSLDYASWKDRKMLAKALRPIYAAASAEAAEAALDAFADGEWGRKFPTVVAAWRWAWAQVIPFFAFPPEIRRVIYTTDEIDKPPVDRIGCYSVRSRRAVFPSRPGSRRRRAQRRSRVILVANSGAAGGANKSRAMTFACNNDSRQSRLRVFSIFLDSATGKHSRIAPRNSSL
jgi:hypothetical protein